LFANVTLTAHGQCAAESRSNSGPALPPSAFVALLTRTSSGRFVQHGSGFCVEPGVVVTVRDKRRVDADVYVRAENSERLFKAPPVASAFFSDLDVYRIEGANVGTLRLSDSTVRIGDAVGVRSLPFFGIPTLTAHVSSLHEQGVFAVALAAAPLSAEVGGPVLTADGLVVGVMTGLRLRDNDYLVVPVARIAARLAGKQEPGAPVPTLVPSARSLALTPPVPSDGGQGGNGLAGRRVVTKARIHNAPRPVYTSEARENGTQGSVIVRAVLGVNGKVTSVSVVRGLPDGLNETAIEAAYKLEFTPALDAIGVPIDSSITISINFTISGENLNGTWYSIEPSGGEPVQFFLQTGGDDGFRGYAVLDFGPGDIACLPMRGRLAGGVLDLTATRASDGCTFRWTGSTGTAFFPVEEVRNCGVSVEAVRRSFRLSSIP
jgi:TonB family protein